MGAPDLERVRPRRPPPRGCPGLGECAVPRDIPEGAQDSERAPGLRQAGPPAPWGGERMTPPSRCLCPPRAAALCCTNPRAPAAPSYTPLRKGAPWGAASSLPFLLLIFFLPLEERRTECSILPYLCFYSGTNGCVCVCVSLCWFFKEMGRRKKILLLFLALAAPFCPSDIPPALFVLLFLFLFCYESTFLFVILRSPGFLFSVKSP